MEMPKAKIADIVVIRMSYGIFQQMKVISGKYHSKEEMLHDGQQIYKGWSFSLEDFCGQVRYRVWDFELVANLTTQKDFQVDNNNNSNE